MKKEADFLKHLETLFQDQRLATLSTQRDGQPYASLVAYLASKDFRHIYFATPKTTRKYDNLRAENRVAILINNSMNKESDFQRAIAVTAVGRGVELGGQKMEIVQKQFLDRHPYLTDFVREPTTVFIDVAVNTYYMVRNLQTVTKLQMSL